MNPCDPCAATKHMAGNQMTMVWHVDDLKVSHVGSKAVDQFVEWVETKCGDPKIGKVKSKRGKLHECLGMALDYGTPQDVGADMTRHANI